MNFPVVTICTKLWADNVTEKDLPTKGDFFSENGLEHTFGKEAERYYCEEPYFDKKKSLKIPVINCTRTNILSDVNRSSYLSEFIIFDEGFPQKCFKYEPEEPSPAGIQNNARHQIKP